MRRCLAALLVLLATIGPVLAADDPTVQEQVFDAVEADWNGDGVADRALLLVSAADPQMADVRIELSGSPGGSGAAVTKRHIAWRSGTEGMQPALELNARGSLLLSDGNDSVGPSRWFRTLTLAYRDGDFVVAGYTFSAYDTPGPGGELECDVNLLHGRGFANGKPFRAVAKSIRLADWTDDDVPAACR